MTLHTTIQFLNKALWLMIMYYQTEFGSKRFSSSKRYSRNCHILITWALAVTLTLKIANQSFCMTLWLIMMHHNTKFGNKMFGGLQDSSGQTLTFWPFAVTLTLNVVIQFFSNSTLANDDVSPDQVWLPRNQQFRKYSRKSNILIIWALTVTVTLKVVQWAKKISTTKNFNMTLWIMMLNRHNKFGNKMFCDSENIIQTNIHWYS